jgi:hypothetical protein
MASYSLAAFISYLILASERHYFDIFKNELSVILLCVNILAEATVWSSRGTVDLIRRDSGWG